MKNKIKRQIIVGDAHTLNDFKSYLESFALFHVRFDGTCLSIERLCQTPFVMGFSYAVDCRYHRIQFKIGNFTAEKFPSAN